MRFYSHKIKRCGILKKYFPYNITSIIISLIVVGLKGAVDYTD